VDTFYTPLLTVGINDSIHLHAAASDSFGGTIAEYAWNIGSTGWNASGTTGDTGVIAPSNAQTLLCSLRVRDDDGTYSFEGVDIAIWEWTTFTDDDGLAGDVVTAIAVDPDGVRWFGTGTGVSAFDGSTWTTYTQADGLVDNAIMDRAVEPDGTKWFATASGVCSFDGTNWITYTTANSDLVSDDVRAIAVDSSGVKWFATNSGVSSFKNTQGSPTWNTYTQADGLGNNNCRDISVEEPRRIWVATTEGVSAFLADTWTTYSEADGVSENTVDYVAVDYASQRLDRVSIRHG